MKKNILFTIALIIASTLTFGQTSITYNTSTAAAADYTVFNPNGSLIFFNNDGLLIYKPPTATAAASQHVLWRKMSVNQSASSQDLTMNVGDTFEITLRIEQNNTTNFGIALLSSPSATTTFADRINNYAVQVNLNGNAPSNWEIVSNGGAISTSTASNSTSETEFKITFSLTSSTQMLVTVDRMTAVNSGVVDETSSNTVTLNNTDINTFSIYNDVPADNAFINAFIIENMTYRYYEDYVWQGISSANANWNNSINWVNGAIPANGNNVRILGNTSQSPIVNVGSNIEFKNLNIDVGANLTIDTGNSITINENTTNFGSVIANPGSAIIHNTHLGIGSYTYKRDLTPNNWHLVSVPFFGETFGDIYANNALANGTGGHVGLGGYDTGNQSWGYFTETDIGNSGVVANLTTALAELFAANITSGDFEVTGSLTDSDDVTREVRNYPDPSLDFNAIGNPYPAYFKTDEFLTSNSSKLEHQTIWLWDPSLNGGVGGYITKVTIDNFVLAPMQGFFVKVNNTNPLFDSVTFFKDSRTTSSSDTFLRNNNSKPEIEIAIKDTEGIVVGTTKLYYVDGASTGFDNGYDGPAFTGATPNQAIYTQLVDGNDTTDYAIQSLPNENHQDMIVPLKLVATAGSQITFSAMLSNFSSEFNVYLEDRDLQTFTNLKDADQNYSITLNENSNQIGRFYLHTTTSVLSTDDVFINDSIKIYTANNQLIVRSKDDIAKATLLIHDISGKIVVNKKIHFNNQYELDLSNYSSGIYIVKLMTETYQKTKKIAVE